MFQIHVYLKYLAFLNLNLQLITTLTFAMDSDLNFHHHNHILDPILGPLTKLAGFCMVIVFTTSAILFDRMHPLSPVHFHLILYLLFPHLFRSSSSSTTTHFKFQSLHYHIFIYFPQSMTVSPNTTWFSHPI